MSGKDSGNQCAGKRSLCKPWPSREFVFDQVWICCWYAPCWLLFSPDSVLTAHHRRFDGSKKWTKYGRKEAPDLLSGRAINFDRWLTRKWRASGTFLGPLPLSCSGDILATSSLTRIGSRLIALPCSLFPCAGSLCDRSCDNHSPSALLSFNFYKQIVRVHSVLGHQLFYLTLSKLSTTKVN